MNPNELASINVGDKLLDIGQDRTLTVIYTTPYADGDATIVAVANPDAFSVITGDAPIPKGLKIVREYAGPTTRFKIVTKDDQAVHWRNAEIIGANDAYRWEKLWRDCPCFR